jgi:large subunit ribosomal protein L6
MSRVGKEPIKIPEGVKVTLEKDQVKAEKKGKGSAVNIPDGISVEVKDSEIKITRKNDSGKLRSMHGLTRSLLANLVNGLDKTFSKELQIVGRGKRAKSQGNILQLELGFSHSVKFPIPEDIQIEVLENNIIKVSGFDKQQVGEVAAEIRDLQPPEPYKGAGIRYKDERVRKKAGKTAIGGGFTGSGQ